MTNDELRKLDMGLAQLRRQPLKPTMNFMVAFAINTLTPAFDALNKAQKDIITKFVELDELGNEKRDPDDNSLVMKPEMTLEDYQKELNELFDMDVDPTLPKFRFRLSDFEASGVSIPFAPEITLNLGPLVSYDGLEDHIIALQQKGEGPPTRGPALNR